MSFDIDTLIKKFSYSNPTHYHTNLHHHHHNHQQNLENTFYNCNEKNKTNNNNNNKQIEFLNQNQISTLSSNTPSKKSSNKCNLTTSLIANSSNSYSPTKHHHQRQPQYQQFVDTIESSSSSSSSSSSASFASSSSSSSSSSNNNNNNNISTSDKAKFFNTLKSLFAIFDPECNGSIDINELDVLGGNRNEILNDVLKYLRTNISSSSSYSSSAFLSPQYLQNSTNNFQSENCNKQISATTNANEFLHNTNNNKTNLNKVNNNNNNNNLQDIIIERLNTNDLATLTSRVTFEEFIKAAEIVLERRKQKKFTIDQLTNNNNNNNNNNSGVQVRHIDANNRPHAHSLNRNSSGGNITNNNNSNNNNTLTPNNNIYNLSHVSSSSLNNLNSKSNYYMLHGVNGNVAGTEAQQENVNSHIHLAGDARVKMSQSSSNKNNYNNIGGCSFYLFI
jgi:hypothetical protein